MASPLRTASHAFLNAGVLSPRLRTNAMDEYKSSLNENESNDPPSSPFVENINPTREKSSPIKSMARVSPNLLTSEINVESRTQSPSKFPLRERSPRKLSAAENRFPIKINPSPTKFEAKTEIRTVTDLMAENSGLAKAIEILEDDDTVLDFHECIESLDDMTVSEKDFGEQDNFADETAFSTFSAVPDMTMFAKIGHSPTRFATMNQSPRRNGVNTPSTAGRNIMRERSESPTPRRYREERTAGDTTNLILDFTEQFKNLGALNQRSSPSRRRDRLSPTKSQTVPDLLSLTHDNRTPSRQPYTSTSRMSNLIDFDIPPAPTPRSIPTVTQRELETLKSNFLSEISSLKASLSGKEAEIRSLKSAVGDAEKRAGDSMEQLLEARGLKDQMLVEKEGWEKRGREMEVVLRNVKEEIIHGEREREGLEGKLEESEKRREAAELMAQEAESKIAAIRAESAASETSNANPDKNKAASGREVEVAVEKVARELHVLYKSKHETKVAALKKSYESRWEKKIKELQASVEELNEENEKLRIGRDATMSGVIPKASSPDVTAELKSQIAEDAKIVQELKAKLEGHSEELKSIKQDNLDLRRDLERERIEKGELVAACDELLELQETITTKNPTVSSGMENLRGSISRASGIRAPTSITGSGIPTQFGDSRVGRVERKRSGSSLGIRPGSGLEHRSGIMSSIERMGNHKGRGD